MENQFKVVMLPTNEASTVFISTVNNKLLFEKKEVEKRPFAINQHLYIVDTQATIEVGDWIIADYNTAHRELFGVDCKPSEAIKSVVQINDFIRNESSLYRYDYKSIASTNSSLGLPAPPQDFIEAYCANPDLIIVSCNVFEYDNTCHIEYCTSEDKQNTIMEIDAISADTTIHVDMEKAMKTLDFSIDLLWDRIDTQGCFFTEDDIENLRNLFKCLKKPSFANKFSKFLRNQQK